MSYEKKSLDDFRETGLFLLANQFLHIFGWVLVIEEDDAGNQIMFPARTTYRGFSEESQTRAYQRIARHMKEHGEEILNDFPKDDSDK